MDNSKNILILGDGGISCEVVIQLFKSYLKLTLMDLDTIAKTNLTRQFCFRSTDVGRYKVDVGSIIIFY
jgi:ubiquitin-activating enzyme E1 C